MALLPSDPAQRKNVILGSVLLVALFFLFYTYVYTPRTERIAEMQTRLEQLENQNARARGLTRGLEGDADSTLALYRRQLESVEALIPSSEELPDLLDAISVEAQRTGVEMALIEPSDVVEEQYYTRRVYDMAVVGRYHDIGEFLTRVASLSRIVTPTNLTLSPQGASAVADDDDGTTAPRLEARFSIETYVIPSTPLTDEANAF